MASNYAANAKYQTGKQYEYNYKNLSLQCTQGVCDTCESGFYEPRQRLVRHVIQAASNLFKDRQQKAIADSLNK